MTPRQEALTKARRHIEAGRDIYICFALQRVAYCLPDLEEAAHELVDEIHDALGDAATLSGWLLNQVWTGGSDRPEPYYTAWVQEDGVAHLARLAWIDRMLEDEKH